MLSSVLLSYFQSEKLRPWGRVAWREAETAGPPCLGFPSANSGRSGEREVVPGLAGRRIPAAGGGRRGGNEDHTGLAAREKSCCTRNPA